MANMRSVRSVMVEFNRHGVAGSTIQAGTRYVRTTGDDEPVCEIVIGLTYEEFVRSFYALRYPKDVTQAEVDAALATLQGEADKMLCTLPADAECTTQIDLVTSAAELWAFPFEAYGGAQPGVVLTRRIRGKFGQHVQWPAVPRILFAHAAITSDLSKELVEEHIAALRTALLPWTGGGDPSAKLLLVKEIYSPESLQKACIGNAEESPFTHIHLLAHGIPVPSLLGRGFADDWGVRLSQAGTAGVHPTRIADALTSGKTLPVTITVASCDSANQSSSAAASYSLAQELHRRGVPVVVASQLPLTQHGSGLLTKHFYQPLLRGEDVRNALDDVRTVLRADTEAGHDWLSVVAYVRLPEDYDDHLRRVALKMELAMLRAAQAHADQVIAANNLGALDVVEQLVRDRITALDVRLRDLQGEDHEKDRLECQGLLASAHKRLAELLYLAKRDPAEQRQELEASLQHYSAAFKSNLNMHWQGVQQLALQAVLHGSFDPIDYGIVLRGAMNAAEGNPDDYWPLGTIAELHLLAAFAGKPVNVKDARTALETFKQCATSKDKTEDIDSPRRQLKRYVDWWTKANGFNTDLGQPAAELAALLT